MQRSHTRVRLQVAAIASLILGIVLTGPAAAEQQRVPDIVSPQAIGEVIVRLSCNGTTDQITWSASGSGASPVVPIKLEKQVSYTTANGGGGDFQRKAWTTVYSNSSGSWSSPNVEDDGQDWRSYRVTVWTSYGGRTASDTAECFMF
jgi:hypothetical protein